MLRRALPVLSVVLPLLLAFALSACGDDSLSASQLRTQASTICTRTTAATDRVALPSAPAQGELFLRQGLSHLRPAAARLRALRPPQDLRQRYDRAAQLAGQEVALISRSEQALARGDDPTDTVRQLAATLQPLTTEENAYWRGLDIPACVRR